MGVDVHIIIKNDFVDIGNKAKALEYARGTVENIKEKLSCWKYGDVSIEIKECEGDIYFDLPTFNIPEIHLHAGFWEVWTGAHYQQLTLHEGEDFHIRNTAYELAKLFNQRDAWYCMDEDSEDADLDLLDWLQFMIEKHGRPNAYDVKEILEMEEKSGGYIESKPFYYDTFLECKIFDELQSYGFSIEDLTPEELEELIYEEKQKDKGCLFLDGVLAHKSRYY